MRKNLIHPVPLKRINEMTWYDGLFGKVFGGCDVNLKFEPPIKSCPVNITKISRTAISVFHSQAQKFRVSSANPERESLGCCPSIKASANGGKKGNPRENPRGFSWVSSPPRYPRLILWTN